MAKKRFMTNFTAKAMKKMQSARSKYDSPKGAEPKDDQPLSRDDATKSASVVYTTAPEQQYGRAADGAFDSTSDSGEPVSTVPTTTAGTTEKKSAGDGWASVKNGTIDEVTEWVGDDKKRAQKAIREEKKKDSPRSTLIEKLSAKVSD